VDGSCAGPVEDFVIRRREEAAVAPTTGPISRAPDSGGLVLADTEAFGSGPNVPAVK